MLWLPQRIRVASTVDQSYTEQILNVGIRFVRAQFSALIITSLAYAADYWTKPIISLVLCPKHFGSVACSKNLESTKGKPESNPNVHET